MAKRDYYEVLGVQRDAPDSEIKKAFRSLARELHPDVSEEPDAQERFREVAEAYEVLSDGDSRSRYDRFGHEGMSGQQFHTEQFMDGSFLNDLLSSLFGGAGGGFGGFGQAGSEPGADARVAVELTLAEAAVGKDIEVPVELVVPCGECDGSGAAPGSTVITCADCDGAGQLRQVVRTPLGQMVRQQPCNRCRGRGRIPEKACPHCRGRGRLAEHRTVEVAIPAGIDDGQSLRVTGGGHAGELGAPSGDLYVRLSVKADRRFQRDELDLIAQLDLTLAEAVLGVTKEIETLEGPEPLEVEAGVQPGAVISLRGRGMPSLRGGGRGSLRYVVNVQVPRKLSDEQRAMMERFMETESDRNYGESGGFRDRLRRAFGT